MAVWVVMWGRINVAYDANDDGDVRCDGDGKYIMTFTHEVHYETRPVRNTMYNSQRQQYRQPCS